MCLAFSFTTILAVVFVLSKIFLSAHTPLTANQSKRSVVIILLVYFNITLRRKIPKNDIQRIVASWGQPGSPTEAQAKFPTEFSRDIIPRPCHSHNDYTRKVPLYDALAAGCTGVEADVWLTKTKDLLVGHTEKSLAPSRSLKSLYIDPLLAILAHQNPKALPGTIPSSSPTADSPEDDSAQTITTRQHGVFDTTVTASLTLLIDIKTDGATTLPLVLEQLEPLRAGGWLTHWNGSAVIPGVVTVVGTGNTPFHQLLSSNPITNAANNTTAATYRDVFFDAPLAQLWGEDAPANNTMYTSDNSDYASTSFAATIGKVWHGMLSPTQVEMIRGQVGEARKRGLRARYWDTPGWPVNIRDHVWDVLEKEGVGMLNVDDLTAATQRSWT
ncbi:MAG: hypothetical protein Q9203_002664 [Teloschistes exilis]